MQMIAHAEINGCHYYNVTIEDLQELGIGQSIIDAALDNELWKEISGKRSQLLFETDWTQGQDSPLSPEKIAEFAAYRQELRDVPQTYSSPEDVIWPEKPVL